MYNIAKSMHIARVSTGLESAKICRNINTLGGGGLHQASNKMVFSAHGKVVDCSGKNEKLGRKGNGME